MADLRDSSHFVSLSEIPRIPSNRAVREVFEILGAEGKGGFLAMSGTRAQSYVVAGRLADAVLLAGNENVERLRDIIERPLSAVLVALAPTAVVSIAPRTFDAATEVIDSMQWMQEQADAVFRIERATVPIGWVLNHERVRETLTQRILIRCTNPHDPHDNADFDHGRCRKCPYPLQASPGAKSAVAAGAVL